MSTLFKGILGPFAGKVGTVIGSYIRKKAIMRSLPIMPKTTTESQQEHRSVFTMAGNFLRTMAPLLKKTYPELERGASGFSEAMKPIVEKAISGTPPVINYSFVQVSYGSLNNVDNPVLTPSAGIVTYRWTDNTDPLFEDFATSTDKAVLVAYCESLNRSTFTISAATRGSGTAVLNLPAAFQGKVIHTWLAFVSDKGKKASPSVYTGSVTAL